MLRIRKDYSTLPHPRSSSTFLFPACFSPHPLFETSTIHSVTDPTNSYRSYVAGNIRFFPPRHGSHSFPSCWNWL